MFAGATVHRMDADGAALSETSVRWRKKLKGMHEWHALLDELQAALPQFSIGNATATCDAG
jgi:predicted secreted protein